jgi:hypothetical protein
MQSGSPLAFWAMAPPEWRKGYNINESDLMDPKTTNLKKYLKALDEDTIKEMVGKVCNVRLQHLLINYCYIHINRWKLPL